MIKNTSTKAENPSEINPRQQINELLGSLDEVANVKIPKNKTFYYQF